MRIRYAAKIGLSWLAIAAFWIAGTTAWAQDKPSMTVILPSMDDFYSDLRLIFSLVGEKGDEKGFATLKDTVDTFIVGVDTTKAGGVRIFPTADGLQSVLTLPVKNNAEFKNLLMNLWDVDVKTAPPPDPKLIRQVPAAIQGRQRAAQLQSNERLIFKLYDGFLRYEPGLVSFATKVETARLAKGPLPADLLASKKLTALIDGTAQAPEKRKQGFAAAKKELVAAIVKGEKENEAVFEARKSLTEQQIAELERFFVEASKVLAVWSISPEKKEAELNIDLTALPNTDLEKSVEQLDTTPDEFAGVSKGDAIFSLSANFPLDPMRQEFVKNSAVLHRASLKKGIADNEKLSAEVKGIDSDLVDLFFDIVDGTSQLGIVNGFVRTSKDADGSFSTVAGGRVPEGTKAKFEKLLSTLAARDPANKLDQKVHVEGEIEIHKLSVPKLGEEIPEFVGKEGVVFIGASEKTVWLAAGNGALDLLKKAINETTTTGPKPGLVVDLSVKLGPYIEFINAYYTRNPAAVPKKNEQAKPRAGAGGGTRRVETSAFFSEEDLRKIALDVFKQGSDALHLSLGREGKTAQVRVRLEEGLLRFAGTAASKFIKENLED